MFFLAYFQTLTSLYNAFSSGKFGQSGKDSLPTLRNQLAARFPNAGLFSEQKPSKPINEAVVDATEP